MIPNANKDTATTFIDKLKVGRYSSFKFELLVFLFSPFLAFVRNLMKIQNRPSFWIVLMFAMFYSYSFMPVSESDADRYNERLSSLEEYDFDDYLEDLSGMYNGKGFYQDAYIYTVQFLVSPVIKDIKLYRLVFGFIYFLTFLTFVKNLQMGELEIYVKYNWFFIGLVFIIPFTAGINGVRWPLAFFVFTLGSYMYVRYGNIKYIILASLSVLIHFIFFYSVFFLLLFVFTRSIYKPKFVLFLLLLVLIFGSILSRPIKSNFGVLGKGVEEKSLSFTEDENYRENRSEVFENLNWYVTAANTWPYIFVFSALLATTILKIPKSSLTNSLQYFAFINFIASILAAQIIDETSNRYTTVSIATGLIYLYHLYLENSKNWRLKFLNYCYFPILLLVVLVTLRADLYTVSPNLVFGNIFTELLISYEASLQELILGK